MITRITTAKDDGLLANEPELLELLNMFGTSYYEVNDEKIIKEINSYLCPIRLYQYLDKLEEQNLIKEIDKTEADKEYYYIDLDKQTREIAKNITKGVYGYDDYLEKTSHLNKYGA